MTHVYKAKVEVIGNKYSVSALLSSKQAADLFVEYHRDLLLKTGFDLWDIEGKIERVDVISISAMKEIYKKGLPGKGLSPSPAIKTDPKPKLKFKKCPNCEEKFSVSSDDEYPYIVVHNMAICRFRFEVAKDSMDAVNDFIKEFYQRKNIMI